FARDVDDVGLIVGEAPSPDREVMRIKLYIDFAFIAAYSSLFVVLGLLAARGPAAWHKVAGMAATMLGPAAGLFDILENRAILVVVGYAVGSDNTCNAQRDSPRGRGQMGFGGLDRCFAGCVVLYFTKT